MKKTLSCLILLLSLVTGYKSYAEGYAGVISSDTGKNVQQQAAPASTGGYNGVTSWDSVVSGSLYDFVNEAAQTASGNSDAQNSTALSQLIGQKRANFSSLLSQKNAIEKQKQSEYFAQQKKQIVKSMQEFASQTKTLQR